MVYGIIQWLLRGSTLSDEAISNRKGDRMSTSGAVCEIKVGNGGICGVTSIGRCANCGRAFCRSHQAHQGLVPLIDMCAPCFAQTPQEIERVKAWQRHTEQREAQEYLLGSAETDLHAAKVQPTEIYWIEKR
jgi:hypothetical protein